MAIRRRKGESLHDWFVRRKKDPSYQRKLRRASFLAAQDKSAKANEIKMFGHKNSSIKKIAGDKKLGVDPIYMKTDKNGLVYSSTGRREKDDLIHVRVTGQGSRYTGKKTSSVDYTFANVDRAVQSLGFRIPRMGRKASTGRSSG